MNCAIDKAVADAQTAGINIVYVDVTNAFDGHGIGGTESFSSTHHPHSNSNSEAFHPTPAGYVAYAAAISAALPNSWGANQDTSPNSSHGRVGQVLDENLARLGARKSLALGG